MAMLTGSESFFFHDRAIHPYFIKRENVYRESTKQAGEQPAWNQKQPSYWGATSRDYKAGLWK